MGLGRLLRLLLLVPLLLSGLLLLLFVARPLVPLLLVVGLVRRLLVLLLLLGLVPLLLVQLLLVLLLVLQLPQVPCLLVGGLVPFCGGTSIGGERKKVCGDLTSRPSNQIFVPEENSARNMGM